MKWCKYCKRFDTFCDSESGDCADCLDDEYCADDDAEYWEFLKIFDIDEDLAEIEAFLGNTPVPF